MKVRARKSVQRTPEWATALTLVDHVSSVSSSDLSRNDSAECSRQQRLLA